LYKRITSLIISSNNIVQVNACVIVECMFSPPFYFNVGVLIDNESETFIHKTNIEDLHLYLQYIII